MEPGVGVHGPTASESLHMLLSGPGETDLKGAEQGLTPENMYALGRFPSGSTYKGWERKKGEIETKRDENVEANDVKP